MRYCGSQTVMERLIEVQMNDQERAAGLAPTPGYRYAERVGNRLFVAGQVPLDAEGILQGIGDPEEQTRQCLRNLDTLLACHGFERRDIRRLVIHVKGSRPDLGKAWEVVRHSFEDRVPPATLLGAAELGYEGQLVEIDATILSGKL